MKTERSLWLSINNNDLLPVDKNFSKTYYLAYKSNSGRWIFTERGPVDRLRVEQNFKANVWAEIDWPKPPKE